MACVTEAILLHNEKWTVKEKLPNTNIRVVTAENESLWQGSFSRWPLLLACSFYAHSRPIPPPFSFWSFPQGERQIARPVLPVTTIQFYSWQAANHGVKSIVLERTTANFCFPMHSRVDGIISGKTPWNRAFALLKCIFEFQIALVRVAKSSPTWLPTDWLPPPPMRESIIIASREGKLPPDQPSTPPPSILIEAVPFRSLRAPVDSSATTKSTHRERQSSQSLQQAHHSQEMEC